MSSVVRGLEARFPRLKDNVTNAVLLFQQMNKSTGPDGISRGLVAAHLQKTADDVSQIHPKEVVTFRKVWPHVKLLVPLFIVFTAVLILDAQFVNRSLANLFDPLSTLPDRKTVISVERPPPFVLRGKPVVIRAKASGYVPDRLLLRLLPEAGEEIAGMGETEGDA